MKKLGFFQRILRGLVFKKPTIKGQIFALLFSGAFLGGGLLMASAWVVPVSNFIESQQWVAAEAIVTSSEVESLMIRALSSQVWIMVPFSIPFLLVGIVGVSYALLGGAVWSRSQKLKEELISEAPARIAEELRGPHDSEENKLTFTGVQSIHEGVILLLVSIFWNGTISVFLIVVIQMWMTGDSTALMISLILVPFVLVGLFLLRTTFRSLFGSRPPAWVTVCGSMMQLGLHGSAPGTLSLMWMPEPVERPDFRKCKIGLVRMKSQQRFKKWKQENPGWKGDLVPLKKDEVGESAFEFERLDSNEKSWLTRTYDLHLVLCWERPDGHEKEKTWQVSPIRNEDA